MASDQDTPSTGAAEPAAPEPTRTRKILSALAVAAYVALIWWFIEWRTAPPPPPKVEMPQPAPSDVP